MDLSKQINVKTDPSVHAEAVDILNKLGLNLSSAINIFLIQVIQSNGIPFEIRLKEEDDYE